MTYRLTAEAESDLLEIYLYGFQNFGESQAEAYFAELESCFEILSKEPLISRERTEFTPPVRIHHHGRHLVVYGIQADLLLIIRVLHDSMDVKRHL